MMRKISIAAMMTVICLALSVIAIRISAVTENEILGTVYQLEKDRMSEPHNGFTFMVEQRSDGKMLDAVYTAVDVWGGTDRWYAPDTSICIIGYDFMHPSNSCRPVLVWTAPYDGKIGVYTKYSALKDGDDTTEISLRLNDRTIWSNITSTAEEEENDSLEVKSGDRVMWVVDCITDQTNDTTNTVRRIWYTEVDLNGGDSDSQESSDVPSASEAVSDRQSAENTTTVKPTGNSDETASAGQTGESGDGGNAGTTVLIVLIAVCILAVASVVVIKTKNNPDGSNNKEN